MLMSVVFPQASWDQTYAAALLPFHLQSFYATPSFARLGMADEECMPGLSEEAPVGEHVPDVSGRGVVLQEHPHVMRLITQPGKERQRRIERQVPGISLAIVPQVAERFV